MDVNVVSVLGELGGFPAPHVQGHSEQAINCYENVVEAEQRI